MYYVLCNRSFEYGRQYPCLITASKIQHYGLKKSVNHRHIPHHFHQCPNIANRSRLPRGTSPHAAGSTRTRASRAPPACRDVCRRRTPARCRVSRGRPRVSRSPWTHCRDRSRSQRTTCRPAAGPGEGTSALCCPPPSCDLIPRSPLRGTCHTMYEREYFRRHQVQRSL